MAESKVNTRILNDYEVMNILSHLSLREKHQLSSVSMQFKECVERVIRSQKTLKIRLRTLERRRRHIFDDDVVISERIIDSMNRVIDVNIAQIKNRWELILQKFENLEKIEYTLNSVFPQVFEWINDLFPDIKFYSIEIVASSDWLLPKLRAIDIHLGPKCQSIRVKRFRHFDKLMLSGILRLPSLQSINLIVAPSEDHLDRFLREFPPKLSILAIDNLIYSTNYRILNPFQKRNQIKRLKISFSTHFDGNYLLKFFCKNLTQIEILHLTSGSFNTLEAIKYAKHMKSLTLYPMENSVIDTEKARTCISTKINRLRFYGNYQLKQSFITNLDKKFPNIEKLKLDNLKIYCDCDNRLNLCFICYQKFLQNCSQVINSLTAKDKCLNIELVIENSEPYHQLVLMSMYGLYFDFNQSFKISIKTFRLEYVAVVLLETANALAFRRPDLPLKVYVDSRMTYSLENLTNILSPNITLEFVEIDNQKVTETEQKFIFLETNTKKDKIFAHFGRKSLFMKKFSVFMYL